MSQVEIKAVSMRFALDGGKRQFTALENVSLAVEDGQFVSLIGHSGCGKSTLLNMVAGLLLPTEGEIVVGGLRVAGPGPDRAMVFQSHALLPWMTCFENVHLGVSEVFRRRKSKAEMLDIAHAALKLVHLEHAAQKYPCEISGGMKQRVGIARALAIQPRLLLLDEPFGALDALTRASLQDELARIVADTKCTVIMVTHDIDEALLLSDRVCMMTNGPAATIGEVLDIELKGPRDRVALSTAPVYGAYRQRLLEFLYTKQRHPAAA